MSSYVIKIISLFSCYLFLTCNIYGQQEFAPLGAKWTFQEGNCLGMSINGTIDVEVISDTIVLGQEGKVMELSYHNQCSDPFLSSLICIIKTEGERVYHYLNGDFYLLYDFSANAGDTIFHQTTPFLHSDLINKEIEQAYDSFCTIVDSVSYITIGGETLKRQHVSPCNLGENYYTLHNITDYPTSDFSYSVVEKLGSPRGLFGQASNTFNILDLTYVELLKYEDDSLTYISESVLQTNIEHTYNNEADIKILSKQIIISGIGDVNAYIHIYDINGRLVMQQPVSINFDAQATVSLEALKKGLYIIYIPQFEFSKTIFIH